MTNEAIMFTHDWDFPQLTASQISQSRGSAFEWWYFDFTTEDGIELVIVYSYHNPVLSISKVSVVLELKSKSGNVTRVRNYSAANFVQDIDDKGMRLEFSPDQVLTMTGEGPNIVWNLVFDIDGVQGDLDVTACHRGFLPSPSGRYMFNPKNDRESCVSFSAPATQVQGELTIKGQKHNIEAHGYHDHPWGTALLTATNHHWQWVRARQQSSSIMFAQVQPQPGYQGGLDFLYLGKTDTFEPTIVHDLNITSSQWSKDHWYGICYPHLLEVTSGAGNWKIQTLGSLLDTPIYNRAKIYLSNQTESSANGNGWVEYYNVSAWLSPIIYFFAKIAAFFLRRFPFFGQ